MLNLYGCFRRDYLKLFEGDGNFRSVIVSDYNKLRQYMGIDNFAVAVFGLYFGVLFGQLFFKFGVSFIFISQEIGRASCRERV